MRATAIVNRGGGSVDESRTQEIAEALQSAGLDATVLVVDGAEIAERARETVNRGDPLLIVGGGDGTIGTAAQVLADSDTRLGILPLGTLNHFARDLGIPTDLEQAAAAIASGEEQKVDLAELNGRTFVNNSAIGLYPLMVLDRDAQQRRLGRSKRLAMLVASIRTLARFQHQRLRLGINDREAQVDTPLLFVGNNDYRLEFPGPGQRDSVTDGKLCVLVMRSKTRRGFVAAALRALVGRTRGNDMVRIEDVERLRVESRRGLLRVSVDGEVTRLEPPLDYRIRKGALWVMVPRAEEPDAAVR